MILATCAFALAGLASFQGDERRAAELVEKLRSDQVRVREAAARELKTLGKHAEAALAPALLDGDAEVVFQARHLLRSLKLRADLPSGFLERVPGLEGRLLEDAQRPWLDLFFEVTDPEFRPPRPLTPEDLRFIVERAIAATPSEDPRLQICNRVAKVNCLPASASMARLLGDDNGNVRELAEEALGVVGTAEVTPELAKVLQHPKATIRRGAARVLGKLGGKDAVALLTRALADPSSGVQLEAILALVALDAREALEAISALPAGADSLVRVAAADALIAFRAPEGTVRMMELLSSPLEVSRADAARRLGLRRIPEAAPKLRPLLADPAAPVRGNAAAALGRLRDAESIPILLRLLDDGQYSVRQGAAEGLGFLNDPKAIPLLIRMLDDPEGGVRARAGQSLCRLGSSRGIPLLFRAAGTVGWSFLPLTAVADPALWKRLSEQTLRRDLRGTPEEVLAQLSKDAGLTLELPAGFSENRMTRRQRIVALHPPMSLLQALEEASPPWPYGVILKEGALRVLNHAHALEAWGQWYVATYPDPK